MARPVIMPKFEMSQEEGTVVRWLKNEGDVVQKGDVLLEVETDKVVMEVEAPADGILSGIQAKEGDTVPVTTIIAHLLEEGEELPTTPAAPVESAAPVEKAAPIVETKEVSTEKRVSATPVAERAAKAEGIDISEVPSSSPDGKVTRQDVEKYIESRQSKTIAGKVRATPAARRVGRERAVDLGQVPGSGPRGRVQEQDVLRFTPTAQKEEVRFIKHEQIIPLEGMRKRIAERLQASYQTAPHIMLTVEADVSTLLALRSAINKERAEKGQGKISVTALLVKAVGKALKNHPYLNAHFLEDGIHLMPMVNVGVAVALDNGLIVPVIRDADCLDVDVINEKLEDLAGKARQNRLSPNDVADGTFTISNLGMFGIDHFTAIINPPQTAILAVGRILKRVVVVEENEEESIRIRPMMAMTVSCDHRVVDGASGAQFLQSLVALIEEPETLP